MGYSMFDLKVEPRPIFIECPIRFHDFLVGYGNQVMVGYRVNNGTFEGCLMRPKFTIRPAKKADWGQIRTLVWGERLNPTGLNWQRFVVAVNPDQEVIGCAQVKTHRDKSMELASLVVASDYRGTGVARLIIGYLINAHDGDIYLMCRSSLGELYEKFGFKEIAEPAMPKYFRRISRLVRFRAKGRG